MQKVSVDEGAAYSWSVLREVLTKRRNVLRDDLGET